MKYPFLLFTFFITNVIIAQSDLFQELKYRSVGPLRGGRATTVTGIAAQPNTFYMGATGGGVWKSTDYGVTWTNVSDGFLATPSIGAIRVAESNPNIIYVGTGSDGIRSNVIPGKGVYKSTDAGKKWSLVGLEKTGHIGAVEIHPTNPDIVFVAAIGNAFAPNPERGVFRTKDGGKSWEKVLYIADSIGITDLEFAPDDPNTIYAAAWRVERKPWTIISGGKSAGGIYKSTDGGTTWKKLEKGLPKGLIGKADLAVAKSNPNRLWALVEAPQGEGGVFRSDDRGETFELVSTKKELLDRPFYYCNIDANPLNANVLYVSSTSLWKSTDGGKNWQSMRVPHGDTHDMWINPNDTLIMVECNDGGANVSTNGGRTWSTQFNQPTAELYQVEVDDQFPYWLYAGQQDNYTTIALPSLPPRTMQAGANAYIMDTGGCETGPAVPKPGNPNIVYANCKGNFSVYNKLTGQEMNYYVGAANLYGHHPKDLTFRFQRVAPIHVSPHNPDVVYHCSQYVHKTTDDGKTWEIISPDLTGYDIKGQGQVISGFPITRDITGEEYYSTIYEINESKLQEGLIWVGANDGPIHVTKNGGKSWENVTPKDLPGGGRVDCIDPSPHKPGKAYAAILRYQLGDPSPYIYKTEDYGKSWTRITNGIPGDYPVRTVREDPDREGLLYAGTEYGMFISFDDGKNWQPFQQNLPVTPITDIKVHRKDLVLSTMGRGFWILDNLTPLHQLNIDKKSTALAIANESYRMRYQGTSVNELPTYPAPGVIIDYYLVNNVTNEIKLEILDAGGKVIRSFTGNKNAGSAGNERDMQT
ncbi:MAG: WD40/YVTN/BNR-like repeat-containing protein, partial [Saprospiraceae bacterium]